MDRFSIIVPMLGDDQAFDDTLASVLTTQPANAQIIVAHDGAYDDPYDLGREVTFVVAEGPKPALAQLLNAAIGHAKSEFTTIVRPGVQLPESWSDAVEAAFTDPQIGSVCGALVQQDKPARLVTAGVDLGFGASRKLVGKGLGLNKRKAARLRPAGPTLWAGFYRTELLKNVVPLCPALNAMYLDLDIALAAETLGYESAWLSDLVLTTSDADAIFQESRKPHGQAAERAKRRHQLGGGLPGRLIHVVTELAASPLNAAMIPHAMGRLLPGNRRSDDAFRKRMEQPADQVTLAFEPAAAPLRRAA